MIRLTPLVCCLAFVLAPLAADAAEWPALDSAPSVAKSGDNDIALLVGIEDYLLLPDVPGASQNVRDWETFLRDGLGVSTIVTLNNAEAVREEILTAAERVRDRANEGSTVWVLFVGHGAPSADGTDGLLVGADGQQTVKSLATRSVSQRELMKVLGTGAQARTMMIVDACFSGRDTSGEALAQGVQPVVPVEVDEVPAGFTLMTAARSTEFAGALPGAERPAFSYLMLGAARGWAAEGDEQVTASEAVRFARAELADVVGRDQTPQLVGDGNAILSTGVSETPPRRESEVAAEPDYAPGGGEVTTVHWGSTTKTAPRQDGAVTDDLGYAKFHVGLVGVDEFSALGSFINFSPGVKLIRGNRTDLRLGAWMGLSTYRNPRAPHKGDTYTDPNFDEEFFGTQEVSSVNGATAVFAHLGAGPGFAYRLGHAGGGFDRVIYLDTAAGLSTSPGGYCTSYQRDFISDCTARDSKLGGMFGARLGAEFPFLDVAGHVQYRTAFSDVLVGVSAGISFDR